MVEQAGETSSASYAANKIKVYYGVLFIIRKLR